MFCSFNFVHSSWPVWLFRRCASFVRRPNVLKQFCKQCRNINRFYIWTHKKTQNVIIEWNFFRFWISRSIQIKVKDQGVNSPASDQVESVSTLLHLFMTAFCCLFDSYIFASLLLRCSCLWCAATFFSLASRHSNLNLCHVCTCSVVLLFHVCHTHNAEWVKETEDSSVQMGYTLLRNDQHHCSERTKTMRVWFNEW